MQMNYPAFKQSEIQQALAACQMRIKPEIKALSAVQVQNLFAALQSDDETVRGFACLVALAYGAVAYNVEQLARQCMAPLCVCATSSVDFVRYYAILALARVAESHPQAVSGLQLLESIAGFTGNQLSEDAYDAPAFFLAKYFETAHVEAVTDRTAQQLLVYLCYRLHCQLGDADRGFQVSTILSALRAMTAMPYFAQQSLCARVPTSLITYLSGLLNAGESCEAVFIKLIFDILRNVFAGIATPGDPAQAADFDSFLLYETQALAEMDFYGIVRMYSLPSEQEPAFDQAVFAAVLGFLASAMRTRAVAEDCFNHFQNRASKSTVLVADYLTGILLLALGVYTNDGDSTCLQHIYEIATYFCYFRYISEAIALSPFIQLTHDVMQRFVKRQLGCIEHRQTLEALFGFLIAVTADAGAFIDSTKLFFDDFDASYKLALREPGQRLFGLFEPLVDLADYSQADYFLYYSNINAIYQISQFSVALMPFLHAATSLDLLRSKFKTVRPSRIPPVGAVGLRALLHMLSQRRSVKLCAVVPFSLRLLCRVPGHLDVIAQRSTWIALNNLIDWLTSDENQLSRLGASLARSQADEPSDETLMQRRLNVQGYAIEAVVEAIHLLAILAANSNVDVAILANALNSWAQLTSCSPEKAQEGAGIIRAMGSALGQSGLQQLRGSVSEQIMTLLSAK